MSTPLGVSQQPSLETFIHQLPKAELHVHLEGCLTPALVQSIATRNNIALPPAVSAALSSNSTSFAFQDLTSLMAIYYSAVAVLQTTTDFHDLAWDYLTRSAAQNVRHAEMFFDPQAHTGRGVPFDIVIGGFHAACVRAERELGMTTALIMCFLRDRSAEFAMATLCEGLRYREWIEGVGLDGNGDDPPEKFAAVFERGKKEGWLVTMHCDVDQESSVQHIRQALEVLGADRIDHGTNVVEDEGLVTELKSREIGLICCPISNSVVCGDWKGKEILALLRQGVKVTVNSDDPGYFGAYAEENLLKVGKESDVSRQELVLLCKNAFDISCASAWTKEKWLQELDEYARHVETSDI